MTEQQPPVNNDRRTFFRSIAALGIASGGGALILRHGLAGSAEPKQPTQVAGKGYRETDHIRKYYDTARG